MHNLHPFGRIIPRYLEIPLVDFCEKISVSKVQVDKG